MKPRMLIVHGGAPTAVMNASLRGAIEAAGASGETGGILGARGGIGAILRRDFVDLSGLPREELERLPFTPGSCIGTSREPVEEGQYDALAEILAAEGVGYVLFNGGNGSMEACGKLARAAARRPSTAGISFAGIPKTIDNDLAATDHAPGFGSAARFLAASVAELAQDVASLPIHVCVIESMGRNAGWLTAASLLARPEPAPGGVADERLGPHLVYVPELPFDEERFLDEAKALYGRLGGVVVVASEGLRGEDGKPIVPPVFQVGRSVYYGDVSAHLCGLVIRRLGIKARSEKPGILGRCSAAHQSPLDREEAVLAGREAALYALARKAPAMVGFRRLSSSPYRCETFPVPIEEVMLRERVLPPEFLAEGGRGIAEGYIEWCRPLVGGPLPRLAGRPAPP